VVRWGIESIAGLIDLLVVGVAKVH
jgi:hypothetical protein